MQTSMNPYMNEAGLIEKYIGTAYDHVKNVSENIAKVQHVSDNMQALFDLASNADAMAAFVDNPDFLTWLQANQTNLSNLSGLLASLVHDYAPLAGSNFTGFVKLGEKALTKKEAHYSVTTPVIGFDNGFPHGLSLNKVIGIHALVDTSDDRVEIVGSDGSSGLKIWLDADMIRFSCAETALRYGNRPCTVILTYTE